MELGRFADTSRTGLSLSQRLFRIAGTYFYLIFAAFLEGYGHFPYHGFVIIKKHDTKRADVFV